MCLIILYGARRVWIRHHDLKQLFFHKQGLVFTAAYPLYPLLYFLYVFNSPPPPAINNGNVASLKKVSHNTMMASLNDYRRIVLIAIQDEAYRFGRYYKYVFGRLHINTRRIRLSYRSSLALIGYVGRRRPFWLRYMSRPQRRGPSYARIRITTRGT